MFSVVFEVFVVAYIREQKASGQRNGFNFKWVSLTLSWHNTQFNIIGYLNWEERRAQTLLSLSRVIIASQNNLSQQVLTSHCVGSFQLLLSILSILLAFYQHLYIHIYLVFIFVSQGSPRCTVSEQLHGAYWLSPHIPPAICHWSAASFVLLLNSVEKHRWI